MNFLRTCLALLSVLLCSPVLAFSQAPTLSSISPTSVLPGTQVTFTGSGFGATQGSGTANFNNQTAASIVSWSDTQVVATVKAGTVGGLASITQNGAKSSGISFTISPNPSIASLTPTSGAVGSSVTISGANFGTTQNNSTVAFDGTLASSITSWSAASITATVPAGASSGNVVVTLGSVPSNGVNFTVVPNITSLSPTSGAVGTPVTIIGTGFGPNQGSNSTVSFNGVTGTPTSWTSSSITVPVPSGATTGNVVVTVGGAASNGVTFTVPSGGFVATVGQMDSSRYGQTATQLMSGRVLVAGGMTASGVVNTAELYTASTQTFVAANAMNIARWLHTATLLNDSTVLLAGGSSVSGQTTLNSAEIYDPVAGTFTLLPSTLNTARAGHTATLLTNGQVLIVGGYDPATGIIADAELYDPIAQVFIDLGNTNSPRFHHAATYSKTAKC